MDGLVTTASFKPGRAGTQVSELFKENIYNGLRNHPWTFVLCVHKSDDEDTDDVDGSGYKDAAWQHP